MNMEYLNTIPEGDCIKITMQESINDLVVNHEFFLQREAPNPPLYLRNQNDSLLEVPIDRLIEQLETPKQPNQTTTHDSNLSRPLLYDFDKVDNTLWADKYQVHRYLDLATDDKLNREALIWLQSWNDVVFGKKQNFSIFGIKEEKTLSKPMLILSGPPGSGKTTLAKIATNHFKYAPHEINCALMGSGKDFIDTLKHSLSIKTVSGKPSILILDQIESIDKETIKSLFQILSNKKLKRPIIAVTNDVYAPSLRPLREIAQILKSDIINTRNLHGRLKEICTYERIYVPDVYLENLIKENKADIRACINSLQLVSSTRGDKQLNIDSSLMKIAAAKESSLNIYDVWRDIFLIQNNKNIKKNVLAYGEPDIVNLGLFGNYLSSKYSDFHLNKTLNMIESLRFNDLVSQRVREKQQYELYSTQVLPALTANQYCWSTWFEGTYPIKDKQVTENITETEDAVNSLRARNLSHPTLDVLISEIFPYLSGFLDSNKAEFSKEVLQSLGFEISKNLITPSLKSIIRVPKDFNFTLEGQETVKKEQSQLLNLANQKRKRLTHKGPIFVYHEGLTNAVKRKIRVVDLF